MSEESPQNYLWPGFVFSISPQMMDVKTSLRKNSLFDAKSEGAMRFFFFQHKEIKICILFCVGPQDEHSCGPTHTHLES